MQRHLTEGLAALESGRLPEAILALAAAHNLGPTDVLVGIALSNAYRLTGDVHLMRETLRVAHRNGAWTEPAVAYALGTALLDAGMPREAQTCFAHVVKRLPRDAAALAALAGAHRTLGDAATAWPLIKRAVALAPHNPTVLLTAAQVRHDMGDLPGALEWLDRADARRPNHAPTRLQRAYSVLLQGPSSEGWELFESRPLPDPSTGSRRWNGEPLSGGSILVTAEQGVGDQFQFVRFVPLLVAHGADAVVVECHADAVSLFTANGFRAVARGGTPPATDWHVPMLSLPHVLQLGDDVGLDGAPYLRAAATASRNVASASGSRGGRQLGLVWAGNPAFPGRDARDFDLALLPEILALPDIEWIALQYGDTSALPNNVARAGTPKSWLETAERLMSLDGLVTTDTGIAHLAGALGVPTWVMLQYIPDWRWRLRDTRTAWYPTLRLVRQQRPGDWRSVVTALASDLARSRT